MSDSIATNASGFIVKHDQTQHQVEWNDILEISAYKVDLWMTDMICLAFELSDGRVLEINEEQEGYRGLLAAVESRGRILPNRFGVHPPRAPAKVRPWCPW